MQGYKDWQFFRFKGKRFLALVESPDKVHIKGPGFANYGSYFSVQSFMSYYKVHGEVMRLHLLPKEAA